MRDDGQKVLLITGASSGIGAATARAAADAGWRLALCARSEDKLKSLAEELGERHVMVQRCDVSDYSDQQRMAESILSRFGRIDAVFANAGTGGEPGGFSGAPVSSWKKMVHVNILGVAYTLRATLEEVKKAAKRIPTHTKEWSDHNSSDPG